MNPSDTAESRTSKARAARSRFLIVLVVLMSVSAFAPGMPLSGLFETGGIGLDPAGGLAAIAEFGSTSR